MCTTYWVLMIEVAGFQARSIVKSYNTVLHRSTMQKWTVPLNWEAPPAVTALVTSLWTLTLFGQLSATTKWTISGDLMGEKT